MTRTAGYAWKPLQNDYALIGKVIKVHGVRGEIKIISFSRCPENFKNYKELALVGSDEEKVVYFHKIERSRSRGEVAIVQLEGIINRQEAAALIGCQVWVSRADFPQLDSDEYYWFDLQGMRVVTEEGREIGVIASLLYTKAHDVLVVAGKNGQEYLIPMRGEVIVDRDDSRRILVIAPPPGLLDMNE